MHFLLPQQIAPAVLDVLRAKLEQHIAERSIAAGYACDTCGGLELADRIDIDWNEGRVMPCRVCRRAEWVAMQARLAAEEACPPTLRTGERFADGRPDSWDLASEELFTECALPRETPDYRRDRAEWDARDDKSDMLPWSRTEER